MYRTTPVPSNLSRYYNSESYISHSDQSTTLLDKLYLTVKQHNLRRKLSLINSFDSNHRQLLDIGAGTADFLQLAQQNQWHVHGIEPNPLARNKAKTKGINLAQSIHDLPNKTYDIITLWHVLEHLPNLDDQLKDITSLLSHSGTLIIAVPNYKSYDAIHYKEYWAAYDVPRHLWHFSKKSIQKLFAPYGLTLERTKPMWFDSFYVSILSEKYKNKKNNYFLGFFHGFLSNLQGLKTKEYSSHIYILKKG